MLGLGRRPPPGGHYGVLFQLTWVWLGRVYTRLKTAERVEDSAETHPVASVTVWKRTPRAGLLDGLLSPLSPCPQGFKGQETGWKHLKHQETPLRHCRDVALDRRVSVLGISRVWNENLGVPEERSSDFFSVCHFAPLTALLGWACQRGRQAGPGASSGSHREVRWKGWRKLINS